jgi:hypothetical protein
MRVTASFFKNFDNIFTDVFSGKLHGKFVIRRISLTEALCAIGVLFFVLGFALEYGGIAQQGLSLVVMITSVIAAIIYLFQASYLLIDRGSELQFVRNFALFRLSTPLAGEAIEFIGIGGKEMFNDAANQHVVYIRHGGVTTQLCRFTAGRDAVLMAKAIRQFLGKD